MSIAAKDYFVKVDDDYLRVGTITASSQTGPEDVEMAVYYHRKCHDAILKIFNPVDNEPTFNSPRCDIHLHVDIENAQITVEITGDKTDKNFNYDLKIVNT